MNIIWEILALTWIFPRWLLFVLMSHWFINTEYWCQYCSLHWICVQFGSPRSLITNKKIYRTFVVAIIRISKWNKNIRNINQNGQHCKNFDVFFNDRIYFSGKVSWVKLISGLLSRWDCPTKSISIILSILNNFIFPIAASTVQRCNFGDTECIAKSVDYFVREHSDGYRDINLISIDPLQINKVDIIQSNESPVTLNLSFRDVLFYGLSKMKTKRIV